MAAGDCGCPAMMWKVLQVAVFCAVGFSNIYFELGMNNGWAVSALGLFAAICATYLVSWSIDLFRWGRERLRPAVRHDGRYGR